jgi:hypothetical protein
MRIYPILLRYTKSEQSSGKAVIILDDMIKFIKLNHPEFKIIIDQPDGYRQLYDAINQLINEDILKKINPRKTTIQQPSLALKYRIVKEEAEDLTKLKKEILKLHRAFSLDYYLSNSKQYLKDKEYIQILSDYLDQEEKPLLSINELSYRLFNDEKFFKGTDESRGERILRNLCITYDDLNCYYAYEPFIYHIFSRTNRLKKVGLIIENKDTYWSFVQLLSNYKVSLDIDFFIYGEGKKIISSLRYLENLEVELDNLWYFGDIDREGIHIYLKLREAYSHIDIKPFVPGYEKLINHTSDKVLNKMPKPQAHRVEDIKAFCAHFLPPYSDRIRSVLENGLYIPQEGLSLAGLIQEYAHV